MLVGGPVHILGKSYLDGSFQEQLAAKTWNRVSLADLVHKLQFIAVSAILTRLVKLLHAGARSDAKAPESHFLILQALQKHKLS